MQYKNISFAYFELSTRSRCIAVIYICILFICTVLNF